MNNILFYKNNSLPDPLDESHDGLWFIKKDSEEFYTLYVVSNGIAISEQKVKNTSELINDGENGSSYYIEHQELLNILDGYLPVGYKPDWEDIQNKPIVFPPSIHTHTINEVQGLNDVLDKKADKNDLSDIAYTGDYEDLNNIPIEFPPSPHNHDISDINNLQNILNIKLEEDDISAVGLSGEYADLKNIPSSFPPSSHNHIIGDVVGLEMALESKLEEGDVAIVALTGDYEDLINTPTIPVTSVAGKIGDVILTKADVGLGNVDNTPDLNKPISIAAQSALDNKVDKSTTITGGGGIIIGGSLSSGAVNISIDETYLNNKYLRNDIDDNNNGHTLTLGKLVTPNAEIENLNLATLAAGSNSDEILVVDSTGTVKKRNPASDVSIGVTNAEGTEQFSLGATDNIRFAGSGDTSVNFNPATKTVTITSTPGAGGGGAVTSFNGRTGAVSSEVGDYSTTQVTEGSNLYFTQARVRATPLVGLSLTSSQDIVATDTVLQGLGKAQAQLNNKLNSSRSLTVSGTAGRTIVSGGTQDLTSDREWQIDLAPSGVTAGTYTKISIDTYGRVTTGNNLAAADIPNLPTSKITSGVFPSARLGTGTATAGTYVDGGTGAWTALPSYSAGSGLTLSGTTFSLPVTISGTGSFVQSVAQNTNGITVTLGTPPNTTYSTGSLAELNTGTVSTGRLWGSNVLNSWLTGKLPAPQTLSLGATAGNIAISGGNSVNLTSLYTNTISSYTDFQPERGLHVVYTSGATGYPLGSWTGIRVQRNSGITQGSFEIGRTSSAGSKLYFNIGATGSDSEGWRAFASEEWAQPLLDAKLNLTGGTVTGVIKSPAPVADADLANKQYVDSQSVIESNGFGYSIRGRNQGNYGNPGSNAFDFSYSDAASTTKGATGYRATAFGSNTTASGNTSFVAGSDGIASGSSSIALGFQPTASGVFSIALGYLSIASQNYSIALSGGRATASGSIAIKGEANGTNSISIGTGAFSNAQSSITIGTSITNNSYGSLVIGQLNDPIITTPQTTWVVGSPLLVAGNGINAINRSNAYVLYNDGRSEQIKDMEVTEIGQGFVLKSPDGTRWRITVDNSGNLITTAL